MNILISSALAVDRLFWANSPIQSRVLYIYMYSVLCHIGNKVEL